MTTTYHALKALLNIAAKKDIRYYLVAINIRQESEFTLRLDATDGHVAMWVKVHNLPQLLPVGESRLIERAQLEKVLKMGPAELHFDSGVLKYGEIPLNIVDGRFPNLDRVIPANKRECTGSEIGVDAKLMIKLCKAIEELHHDRKLGAGFILNPQDALSEMILSGSAGGGNVTFRAVLMPCRL